MDTTDKFQKVLELAGNYRLGQLIMKATTPEQLFEIQDEELMDLLLEYLNDGNKQELD